MNKIDKKVKKYIERAAELMVEGEICNNTGRFWDRAVVIARMIQEEELEAR